jgi:HK97 family phage major capsid protein
MEIEELESLAGARDPIVQLMATLGKGYGDFKKHCGSQIEEMRAQLDKLELRANRPGRTGNKEQDERPSAHTKAYDRYLRKGIEDGLLDVAPDHTKALSAGSNPDGGYAVPENLDRQIAAVELNATPMRRVCNVLTVSNENYEKLVSQHGIAGGWVGETDARPGTGTPTLASVHPAFGEIYANPATTQKVLDDVMFDVGQWLADEIGLFFAAQENGAFVNGDGINKPKGILQYAISAAPTFGQLKQVKSGVASTVVPDKLFDVMFALKAAYRAGAIWMMSAATLAEVRKLKDSQGRYLWEPSVQAGTPSMLLGYPVIENEDMPAIAAGSNSILFGNLKRAYTIADVAGTRILRDPYTNKPYVNFYTTKRMGGGLIDSTALIVHTLGV